MTALARWTEVRLSSLLYEVKRPVTVDADAAYREIGIRSHGRGIFHKKPISGAALGEKSVFWLQPGDLVFNIVFAWEGAVALTGPSEAGYIGSHRFPSFKTHEDADARFLPEQNFKFMPEANLEWFGWAVEGLGDANGDGLLDVAIGAAQSPETFQGYAGKVYLFTAPFEGTISARDADLVIQGEGIADAAGASLDGGRDVDRDCLPDLLVAAPFRDDVGEDAGEVYLLTGLTW